MLGVVLATTAADACAATEAPASQPAGEVGNLDDELLGGDLGDLFGPPPVAAPPADEQRSPRGEPIPGAPGRAAPAGPVVPDEATLRKMMERAAGAGEDTTGPRQNPLAAIIDKMRQAERLVGDGRVETVAVPVQRQVVADLERLIAQMESPPPGGGGQGEPKPQPPPEAERKPKPSGAQAAGAAQAGGPPQRANRSGTTSRGGTPQTGRANTAPDELLRAAWGRLPQGVRERMLQSSADEFLPAYRDDLEAYFKRLAEREEEPQ